MRRALLCAIALVVAGCAAPGAAPERSDPGTDRLGWEQGHWYDDAVAVDATDGLNATEQEAIVARQMARIERLRDLEFEASVDVRVITRAEFRSDQPGGGGDDNHTAWNDQVWEGLFIVGEDTGTDESFNDTLGSSVVGYYSPGTGEIVIVSDDPEPALRRGTLVHELVHALQDQQFGLGGAPDTQDRQLARNGVVEGEANLLESRYQQRCEAEWDCVQIPSSGGAGGSSDVNRGLLLVVLTPYTAGPSFVETIERRAGWSAVNDLHRAFPASTEQILDPAKYPDEKPVEVNVTDRSNGEWSRFDLDPVADTVGQASIHAMFLTNGIAADGVQPYEYAHPVAVGWEGDSLVPYRNGDRYGYVWETAWENDSEAREFASAYRDLLGSVGGEFRGGGVAVVPETSPFGDAFRLTQEGSRVRIVNGPEVEDLDAIHGG